MENGSHRSNGTRDVAQIACGGKLVDATPESIRKLADSAMLLSQGARRAIEMKREAERANLDVPATAAAAED
jgi:soluble P-type ATPase